MRNYLNTASHSFIAFAKPDDDGKPETAEKGQAVVYLKGDDTIKGVVLHAENAATAALNFTASMVVHLFTRLYTPIIRDRVKLPDVKTEILEAVKAQGRVAKGKDFSRAWSYRILSLAMTVGRDMQSDYTRKSGIIADSPLSGICRARSLDAAMEFVTGYMARKIKSKGEEGPSNLQVLERAFAPAKAQQAQKADTKSRKGQRKGQPSNNTKGATTAATAKTLMGDHAQEVLQAIPAKSARQRAEKLADKVGTANNVDHTAFVLRSLTFITSPDDLMRIADKATELAKALASKAEAGDSGIASQKEAAAG